MEAILANKPKPVVQRALRALLAPVQAHFGDPQAFRAAAVPILMREAGTALSDAKDAEALAEQAYRMVQRLRAQHFRAMDNPVQVDIQYKALEHSAATGPNSTLRQACFWLAYRLQQAGLLYLRSPEAQNALAKSWQVLENRRELFAKTTAESATLTLDRYEALIAQSLQESITPPLASFSLLTIAGYLLEKARATARALPELDVQGVNMPTQNREGTALLALSEPARGAELNEAKARFSRLTADETAKRFDEFKLQFLRTIPRIAPYAVLGFDKFCDAVEAVLYPYPQQMEWIRAFVKPVYTNASQSTIFDGCATDQSVEQRYQALRKAKRGNTVILELARALAFTKSKVKEAEVRETLLTELDLVKEFDWPTTLEQVTAYWAAKSGG
jgi:hypothetical protein